MCASSSVCAGDVNHALGVCAIACYCLLVSHTYTHTYIHTYVCMYVWSLAPGPSRVAQSLPPVPPQLYRLRGPGGAAWACLPSLGQGQPALFAVFSGLRQESAKWLETCCTFGRHSRRGATAAFQAPSPPPSHNHAHLNCMRRRGARQPELALVAVIWCGATMHK